jgi:hypothetical protein
MLKEMYKQIPKTLLRNKWGLVFHISREVYEKQKHLIHNNRFMGINIIVNFEAQKDKAYLF